MGLKCRTAAAAECGCMESIGNQYPALLHGLPPGSASQRLRCAPRVPSATPRTGDRAGGRGDTKSPSACWGLQIDTREMLQKCSPGSPPPHPAPWDGPGAHPLPGSWQQSGSTWWGQVLEAALHPAGAARWRPGLIQFRGRRLHPPNHHHCHHLRPARPGGETETQRDLSEMIV